MPERLSFRAAARDLSAVAARTLALLEDMSLVLRLREQTIESRWRVRKLSQEVHLSRRMRPARSAGNARFNGVPIPTERPDRLLNPDAVIDLVGAAASTPVSAG